MALFGFREWVRRHQEKRYEELYKEVSDNWDNDGSIQSICDKATEAMSPIVTTIPYQFDTKDCSSEVCEGFIWLYSVFMMIVAIACIFLPGLGMLFLGGLFTPVLLLLLLLAPVTCLAIVEYLREKKIKKLFKDIKHSCQDNVATDKTLKIYKEINAKLEKHDRRKHFWGLNKFNTTMNRAARQKLTLPTMDYLVSQYEYYYNETLEFVKGENTWENRQKINESAKNAAKYAKEYDDLFIKRFEQTKNSTRADDLEFREWFKSRWKKHDDDSDAEIIRNARGMYKHAEDVQNAACYPNDSVYRAIKKWTKYENKRKKSEVNKPAAEKQESPSASNPLSTKINESNDILKEDSGEHYNHLPVSNVSASPPPTAEQPDKSEHPKSYVPYSPPLTPRDSRLNPAPNSKGNSTTVGQTNSFLPKDLLNRRDLPQRPHSSSSTPSCLSHNRSRSLSPGDADTWSSYNRSRSLSPANADTWSSYNRSRSLSPANADRSQNASRSKSPAEPLELI